MTRSRDRVRSGSPERWAGEDALRRRVTTARLAEMKARGDRIAMLTATGRFPAEKESY